MDKKLNVKPVLSNTEKEALLSFHCSSCGDHFIRHGGLVRMGRTTLRFRSLPYRCPSCKITFATCLPSPAQADTETPLWHQDLENYERLVGTHGIPEKDRPCACPACFQDKRKPHRHSHFWREVFTLSRHVRIAIFRFRCPICRYVHSIIPSYLEPYQQMSLDLQEELIDQLEQGATLEAVALWTDTLPEEGSRTDKTIQRLSQGWLRRLHQLQEGLWSWLLERVPHVALPHSATLWTSFQAGWSAVRSRFPVFKQIRFLQGLNRLCLSMTVTGHG